MRELYDLPREVAYFNCAYVSPMLRAVHAAIESALAREARPWEISADDFYDPPDRLRAEFARLIGARPADVAIVPSASYGLATAAANLPLERGQHVLLLQDTYPSNVYSWRRLAARAGGEVRTVPRPADGDWTAAVLDAIDDRTGIAGLPHNHWMDGALLDLERIGAALRERGAALALDASQSLGALPLDVARVQPDFLATCGYKWLHCPYTISFLYVAPHRQGGVPIEENPMNRKGSRHFARMADYTDEYEPGAVRFDVGERANFTLLPGALAALEQLNRWTPEWIAAEIGAKTARIAEEARGLGLEVLPDRLRAPHFLGLIFPDGVPDGAADRLKAQNVHVSVRGRSIRVTPHVYNDAEDMERLLAALRAL